MYPELMDASVESWRVSLIFGRRDSPPMQINVFVDIGLPLELGDAVLLLQISSCINGVRDCIKSLLNYIGRLLKLLVHNWFSSGGGGVHTVLSKAVYA